MADIGIVGSAPATFFTPRSLDEVERRLSTAVATNERRASVAPGGRRRSSVVEKVLTAVDPEKLDFNRRNSRITTNDLEVIKEAKQATGEAFASGGSARYYEPIDSYEGKHRWDPEAEWTEQEERRIVRKVRKRQLRP